MIDPTYLFQEQWEGMNMLEPPIGAIENGREHFRRLAEHYNFSCEGGPLELCHEFQEALRCFEAMAEWINEAAGDWEPSETQQGLIPIPDGYAEQ